MNIKFRKIIFSYLKVAVQPYQHTRDPYVKTASSQPNERPTSLLHQRETFEESSPSKNKFRPQAQPQTQPRICTKTKNEKTHRNFERSLLDIFLRIRISRKRMNP